jgi:hypothetical protein
MTGQFSIADGSLADLIGLYRTDPRSPYHDLGYNTRTNYNNYCRRIERDHGSLIVRQIRDETLITWHEDWSSSGPQAVYSIMVMLRTVFVFGGNIIGDRHCQRLATAVYAMRVRAPKTKRGHITREQVIAVREAAHQRGVHSIALAQALQFECELTQKQVIGEWVPRSEPGLSDVFRGQQKWMPGICWSDIDQDHVLTVGELGAVDLKQAPMVMEELSRIGYPLPQSGPIIVHEGTGRPYVSNFYRRVWRAAANAAGIPKSVKNMDSAQRAGTAPELRKEARERLVLLHTCKDALIGSESVRLRVHKLLCEFLESEPSRPLKPPRRRPARQTDERYSVWKDPAERRA